MPWATRRSRPAPPWRQKPRLEQERFCSLASSPRRGAPLRWRVIGLIVSLKPMQHKGRHSRNYLPHFDSQDVIQFVTFRLADGLPKEALERLRMADRPVSCLA